MSYSGTNQGKYAFHFTNGKLRDGSKMPADGEWLIYPGSVSICKCGLHASWRVSDAVSLAPGPILCLVEVADIRDQQEDKLVCARRKIIARFDATTLLRADARTSALSVIKNWSAPQVVMDWLNTGDEQYRSAAQSAARSAAWSAAESAAESAAWSAARSAAWSVARSAASERLHNAVMAQFIAMGVLTS